MIRPGAPPAISGMPSRPTSRPSVERGARFLRPRPRPAVPRRAEHPALRPAGRRCRAEARHVLHDRADGEPRQPAVKVLSDGWTAVTRDNSLSAQCEHSVGVTDTGYEVFTLSPKGYTRPTYPVGRRAPAPRARRLQNALIRSCLAALPRRRGGTIATSRSIPWTQKPMDAKKRESEREPAAALPHYHGHRERLRERFRPSAPMRSRTTSCWKRCYSARCRGATSSRSPRR